MEKLAYYPTTIKVNPINTENQTIRLSAMSNIQIKAIIEAGMLNMFSNAKILM